MVASTPIASTDSNTTSNETSETPTTTSSPGASTDSNATTSIETSEDPTSTVGTTLASSTIGTDGVTRYPWPPKKSSPIPSSTPPYKDTQLTAGLANILAGATIAMVVMIVVFVVIIVLLVVLVCKVSRRRRLERDLVLRTKQDIFEGVPNAFTSDEISTSHKYNMDCGSLETPITEELENTRTDGGEEGRGDSEGGDVRGDSGEGENGEDGGDGGEGTKGGEREP